MNNIGRQSDGEKDAYRQMENSNLATFENDFSSSPYSSDCSDRSSAPDTNITEVPMDRNDCDGDLSQPAVQMRNKTVLKHFLDFLRRDIDYRSSVMPDDFDVVNASPEEIDAVFPTTSCDLVELKNLNFNLFKRFVHFLALVEKSGGGTLALNTFIA